MPTHKCALHIYVHVCTPVNEHLIQCTHVNALHLIQELVLLLQLLLLSLELGLGLRELLAQKQKYKGRDTETGKRQVTEIQRRVKDKSEEKSGDGCREVERRETGETAEMDRDCRRDTCSDGSMYGCRAGCAH